MAEQESTQFSTFKETSSTTIAWGIAYLINNPSVIEKAHEELDKAIGVENNRLVTVADKTNLPYINAIINVSNFISNAIDQVFALFYFN